MKDIFQYKWTNSSVILKENISLRKIEINLIILNMLRQEEIASVTDAQREIFMEQDWGFIRNALTQIPVVDSFATIITGLRRFGKKYITFATTSKRLSRCYLP